MLGESKDQPRLSTTERISWKETIGFGLSGIPGGIFSTFLGYIQAFYFGYMGLQPGWIVMAQIIYAIWNVLNDPLFGMLQDRTRSRKGRYMPWIKACAPLFSISFVLVFFPPAAWSNAVGGVDYQMPLFLWYLISQLLFDTFFTICYLACSALFPQMTLDGRERTKISLVAAGLGIAGAAAAGFIPMILLSSPTPESISTFQASVVVYGVVALVPWLLLVRWVKERQEYIPPKQQPFRTSAKAVFTNPAGRVFIVYEGIAMGINYFIQTSFAFIIAWIFGYNAYHGTWTFWNAVPFLLGPLGGIVAGTIVQLYIPKFRDLKTAIMISLIFECAGFTIAFLAAWMPAGAIVGTYDLPESAWLVSIGFSIAAFGLPSDIIYHGPVRSDVVDYDEVLTGERREAVYAGVGCILSKPMTSVALAAVPVILALFGLVPAKQGDINFGLEVLGNDFGIAITGVAVAAFLVPAILAGIGIV
nr:MFS transporter [Candidatus Sigynarchaeota archaeon]